MNNVKTVIFTSSDKAVNPTNVMGTSKLMGERLMTAANSNKREGGPVFASTRFGNVLGSSGSVIPIFHNQIAKGGPVTLTDIDMTRFVMSVEESVQLVLNSAKFAKGKLETDRQTSGHIDRTRGISGSDKIIDIRF